MSEEEIKEYVQMRFEMERQKMLKRFKSDFKFYKALENAKKWISFNNYMTLNNWFTKYKYKLDEDDHYRIFAESFGYDREITEEDMHKDHLDFTDNKYTWKIYSYKSGTYHFLNFCIDIDGEYTIKEVISALDQEGSFDCVEEPSYNHKLYKGVYNFYLKK